MRIGVVKQQANKILNDQRQISLQAIPLYGGQAYRITSFREIGEFIINLHALGIIDDEIYTDEVKTIVEGPISGDSFEIGAQDHAKLSSLIQKINAMLPVLMKAIDAFSPNQDEKIINIKLPNDIKNLDDLNEFNSRIGSIFLKIGLTNTNGLRFAGFDCGSEWYQILIDNGDLFKWAVVVIGIAWSCIKIRKEWFDSEISRLTLKSLKKSSKAGGTLTTKDEVVSNMIDIKIEEEVSLAINNGLKLMSKGKGEAKSQLSSAVKAVINEIDQGTEFHLSLNPPKELSETQNGDLVLFDYSQIIKIQSATNEPPKVLEPGETAEKK